MQRVGGGGGVWWVLLVGWMLGWVGAAGGGVGIDRVGGGVGCFSAHNKAPTNFDICNQNCRF